MTFLEQLMALTEAYRSGRGPSGRDLSLTRVSKLVFGDGNKLSAIISGGDLTTKRFERAIEWFSRNWPDAAQWPEGVQRPVVKQAA